MTKKGEHRMHFTKIFIWIVLSLAIGVFSFSCATEKKAEAPKKAVNPFAAGKANNC